MKWGRRRHEQKAGKWKKREKSQRLAEPPLAILDRSAVAMATSSPRLVFGAASGITAEDLMFSTHLGSANMALHSSALSIPCLGHSGWRPSDWRQNLSPSARLGGEPLSLRQSASAATCRVQLTDVNRAHCRCEPRRSFHCQIRCSYLFFFFFFFVLCDEKPSADFSSSARKAWAEMVFFTTSLPSSVWVIAAFNAHSYSICRRSLCAGYTQLHMVLPPKLNK